LYPAFAIASRITSIASAFDRSWGANPPSSPTFVFSPFAFSTFFRLWNVSTPIRSASEKLFAPTGITMNSWMSMLLSAWEPPFRMFIIGTGRVHAPTPPRYRYNGRPHASAAARATAIEAPRIAFAPSFPLFPVPSRSISIRSIMTCSVASYPTSLGAITRFTLRTAFVTPFPMNRFGSPSRSSTASRVPVDAPEGTIARPSAPDSSSTSTSTVGFPRESRTSLPCTSTIIVMPRSSSVRCSPNYG